MISRARLSISGWKPSSSPKPSSPVSSGVLVWALISLKSFHRQKPPVPNRSSSQERRYFSNALAAGWRKHQHSLAEHDHVQNLLLLFPHQLLFQRQDGAGWRPGGRGTLPGGDPDLGVVALAGFFHQQKLRGRSEEHT